MVDTLVLGTSAKAWEFESLHAQIKGNDGRSFFYVKFLFVHRPLTQDCCSVFATIGVLPVRVSCLVRLILFAYDASPPFRLNSRMFLFYKLTKYFMNITKCKY